MFRTIRRRKCLLLSCSICLLMLAVIPATAARRVTKKGNGARTESVAVENKSRAQRHSRVVYTTRRTTRVRVSRYDWINGHRVRRYRRRERSQVRSFNHTDQTVGDVIAGEDPIVRQAAIAALGNMVGTVVAIDPNSGRILAMVNQALALGPGAEPCSTIKISVALAALSENVITKDTKIALGRRSSMNLTKAIAHSNNSYFEALGRRMGFEKVSYYAHQFGLGELAGWNIPGENVGVYPSQALARSLGGVGKMCSFGESISMTPLQLGTLVSAIANGGTLYYLQHPTAPEEIANFEPKVKRYLDIAPLIPALQPGMAAAVQYGTAQRVGWNFSQEEILGKTGTCSNNGTRFGWFASYANTQYGRTVVVVFLTGGRSTFGPKAAEIAGKVYRGLYEHSYFAGKTPALEESKGQPAAMSQ